MIEIVCVLKDRRSVFSTGETIIASIEFRNNTKVPLNLAWASAQLHSTRSLLSDIPTPNTVSTNSTFFHAMLGESGSAKEIFRTTPTILFCDLHLLPSESECFTYSEKLPASLPPSYAGHRIKYSYKLIIGTQLVNSNIKLLKMPFRVLPNTEIDNKVSLTNDTITSLNPFLTENDGKVTNDIEIRSISSLASKSLKYYNIGNTKGKLAILCLYKNFFKLGEDIVGNFEFMNESLRCVEYSVSLNSEEILEKQNKIVKCHAKMTDVAFGLHYSDIGLQIPIHLTPSFTTDVVNYNWFLHFVFVITSKFEDQKINDEHDEWNGPRSLDVETMAWDLPIFIISSSPDLVSLVVQPPTSQILRIKSF